MSEIDRTIAMAIIDTVDLDGYLSLSVEEIYSGLTNDFEDLEIEEVIAVLRRVQHFDPPGVASRNFRSACSTSFISFQIQQLATSG